MGAADVDLEDDTSDDSEDEDEDNNAPTRQRPRLSDVPEDVRPVFLTAFEIFRVLIVTRAAFPGQIQRAMYRQEAWNRAWKVHNHAGDPPEMTPIHRRLVSPILLLLWANI